MSKELLAGLTAERLVQIAADERNVADQLEAQADAESAEEPSALADMLREEAAHHRQLAAICEAVAGAERAHVIIYPQTDEETGELEHWETRLPLRHGSKHVADSPTLLSALGAVGETR